MPSDVTQPASPSEPRPTAEPNRNDRRLRRPDRSPGRAPSFISPASAIPPSMIMIGVPMSCRPTRGGSGASSLNVFADQRLPIHGSIGKRERSPRTSFVKRVSGPHLHPCISKPHVRHPGRSTAASLTQSAALRQVQEPKVPPRGTSPEPKVPPRGTSPEPKVPLCGTSPEPKVRPSRTSPEPWSDSGRVSGVQRKDSARSALPSCLKAVTSRCAALRCAGSRTRFRCAAPFRERAAGRHFGVQRSAPHLSSRPQRSSESDPGREANPSLESPRICVDGLVRDGASPWIPPRAACAGA